MAVSKRVSGKKAALDQTSVGQSDEVSEAKATLTDVTLDGDVQFLASSPARILQESLILSLEAGPLSSSDSTRWSARRSFAFIAAASALLWLAIGTGVAALLAG